MPVGEVIGEIILRPIVEIILHPILDPFLYRLFYWPGYIFLTIVSFGSIRLAPMTAKDLRNKSKGKRHESKWSIWHHRPKQERVLRTECTVLVGILVWAAVGLGIYFETRDEQPKSKETSRAGISHYSTMRYQI